MAQNDVTGEVLSVDPSLESAVYLRLELRFTNRGEGPAKLREYIVTWPGGRKAVVPNQPSLHQGESRITHVKVTGADGNLDSLTVESARVEAVLE